MAYNAVQPSQTATQLDISSASRRPICSACLRPHSACLCPLVQTVHSQVQLLILQHPMEVGHAKNTARLLHLCVPGSHLQAGEVFDAEQLHAWLHAPWPGQSADAVVRPILLYPSTPPDAQLPVTAPPALPSEWLAQPALLRLVVLDGTWRKSRKMLYLNPALQQLPRLALHGVLQGRYAIRKAHAPGQLSTFEAAALALAQLQSWGDAHIGWQQLMQSFDAAITQHQQLQAAGHSASDRR
ncbi:MAG: tRNA-uridine aminocarboxypropyltransferase [Comamonas sp.]